MREGGLRVHVGQPDSTADEGEGDVVILIYPLSGWTMQMKGYRSVREVGYAFRWVNPILQWMKASVIW